MDPVKLSKNVEKKIMKQSDFENFVIFFTKIIKITKINNYPLKNLKHPVTLYHVKGHKV